MRAPTEPPKRTNRMTMKLPSMQPDLVAAPQHPRHVKEARNRVRMRLRMAMMRGMMMMITCVPDDDQQEVGRVLWVCLVQAGLNVAANEGGGAIQQDVDSAAKKRTEPELE